MDIRNCNEEEMKEIAKEFGEKEFRGKQMFEWIHGKQIQDLDEMTNLSAEFRRRLKEKYRISGMEVLEKQISGKKDTIKYLFSLPDGNVIESVWMKYRHGNSDFTVNTQVYWKWARWFNGQDRS